jgi:hypothetical protein
MHDSTPEPADGFGMDGMDITLLESTIQLHFSIS